MMGKFGTHAILTGLSLLLTTGALMADAEPAATEPVKDATKLHSPYTPGKYQSWRKVYAQPSHEEATAANRKLHQADEPAKVQEALNTLAVVKKPSETPSPKRKWFSWGKKDKPLATSSKAVAAAKPVATAKTSVTETLLQKPAAPAVATHEMKHPVPPPATAIEKVGLKQQESANGSQLTNAKSEEQPAAATITTANFVPHLPTDVELLPPTKTKPQVKLPAAFPTVETSAMAAPIPEDVSAKYQAKWKN